MIENSKLVVPTSRSLTFEDKIFISNLISLRHKDKIVGVCLDRDDFIATIDINVGSPILPKSDEKFRWIIKRVVKFMLQKYTIYQPIKSFCRGKIFAGLLKFSF